MTRLWARLFEHYRAYHASGPPRLRYIGYLGGLSYALFYFLRFTRPNARPFDDMLLRLVAVLLFSLLALEIRWPSRLKRYYVAYSYPVLLYCLPTFTILTALQKGGGLPSISNAFIVMSFLVLHPHRCLISSRPIPSTLVFSVWSLIKPSSHPIYF